MSLSVFSSGTQTCTVGTEHDIANINVVGEFLPSFDFYNSVQGDFFEVRVYKKLLTGGTERLMFIESVAGLQLDTLIIGIFNMWLPNDITDTNSMRITLKQVVGTSRQIPYKVYMRDSGVDVNKWNGAAIATPDTAGYPKVTIKSGTGAGELSLSSGVVQADITKINGVSAIVVLWTKMISGGIPGTASGVPTTTTMPASDLPSTHDDQYGGGTGNNRTIIWITGALAGSVAEITDYDNSSKTLTFPAVHTAPSAGDVFVIV